MVSKIFNNWPWKLLSLFLAIILWFTIINYQDPTITKKIEDIEVKVLNEDDITSKNRAVGYLEGKYVDIVVSGKRSIVSKLNSKDINVVANLSDVSITGAVVLEANAPDGIEVVSKTPSVMKISMEQIRSQIKVVDPYYEGDVEEGFVKLSATLTPNQIEITGPESKLALVSSVIVPINIENARDDITLFVSAKLLDGEGNEVEGITMSNSQIQIKVPIQKYKILPIKVVPFGKVGNGYEFISIKPSKTEIKVRGDESKIDNIDSILISDVNLASLTDLNKKINIKITDYLPEGISLMDLSDVYLDVDIRKKTERTMAIKNGSVIVKDLPRNMSFKFVDDEPLEITLIGIKEKLDDIYVDGLDPTVSFNGLSEGIQDVPISFNLPDGVTLGEELYTIKVNLEDIENTTSTTTNDD